MPPSHYPLPKLCSGYTESHRIIIDLTSLPLLRRPSLLTHYLNLPLDITSSKNLSLISYIWVSWLYSAHLSHPLLGLFDCHSHWAVSFVRVRTVCISLMGGTYAPRRGAGIIHQGMNDSFTHSDEISQIADLLLHTDQESLDYSLCWLFWADFIAAVRNTHRIREGGRRERSGQIFSLSAPSCFDTMF